MILIEHVRQDRFILYSSCVTHIYLSTPVTLISELPFQELLISYPLVQSITANLVVNGEMVGSICGCINAEAQAK